MPSCSKCGAQIGEGDFSCGKCGTKVVSPTVGRPGWHEIAERFLADSKAKREKVEQQTMEYLRNRKFKEAILAVRVWETEEKNRDFGRDIDTSLLNTIFECKPKILTGLGLQNEKLETLRTAAAMMVLWGENMAKRWLPSDFEAGLPLDNDTAARMVLLTGIHRGTLERYRGEGVTYVEVFPAPDSCESCKKLAGKRYKLDDIPELPNEHCTHKMGCRCVYLPCVD